MVSNGFRCKINIGSAECAFFTGHGWTKLISYLSLTPESRTWCLLNLNLLNRSVPSHPNFGNVVKHKDTLTVWVPTRVRGSKLSETRGILSGERHEKSARDLRLFCDRLSNILMFGSETMDPKKLHYISHYQTQHEY